MTEPVEFRELTPDEVNDVEGGCVPLLIAAALYGPPALALGIAWARGAFD